MANIRSLTEVAKLLKISRVTLHKFIRRGDFPNVTLRTDKKQRFVGESLYCDLQYSDFGLPDPAPAKTKPVVVSRHYETPEPVPGPTEPLDDDAEFARAFKAGEVGDSRGNLISGSNPTSVDGTLVSAVGPVDEIRQRQAAEKATVEVADASTRFQHQHEPLVVDGEIVTSASDDRHPFNAAKIAAGSLQPSKPPRSFSDQQIKSARDRARISRSFHQVKGI